MKAADLDADAHEHAAFAAAQDPLDVAAATWVVRERNGLDAAGTAALRRWLEADPRHRAAYADMDGTFGRLRRIDAGAVRRRPARGRRTALGVAALGVLGAGWFGWQHWRTQPLFVQDYASARGQQRRIALPDGSQLELDTDTRAELRLYRDRRELRLPQGQALLEVRADAQRPFQVFAGALRITVVGTRFSVRHTQDGLDAGATRVAVAHGRVRVAGRGGATAELGGGQGLLADAEGRLGEPMALPADDVAPWRDGRVSFDGTPLAQALAEFERYGRTGLVLRDPALAALPVGGSFALRRLDAFVQSLPRQLPVRLERRDGFTEIVAR